MRRLERSSAGLVAAVILLCCWAGAVPGAEIRAVPREHPRLLGTQAELRELARRKPDLYTRVLEVGLERQGGEQEYMISTALGYAISGDPEVGKMAVEAALRIIARPVRVGHETFGIDLANCAIVYDLCWPVWTPEQRASFIDFFNRTVDANPRSETSVFHNGWYGYKNAGTGIACYATYYENPRSPKILAALDREIRERIIPAFRMAGDGGGWAEGYYVNYWTCEWMMFCDIALRCNGADYFAMSPEFMGQRGVASMFEAYPGIGERASRRPVPMGDSGGRVFTWERDKALSARRILVNRFREDPAHQVVHAFNETTPVTGRSLYAYMDFLWRDTTVVKGDLESFKLSHLSRGPGYVYARSSWKDDATYFFFKCGDRFTSHQHLDVGHFLIYKNEELAGDGGQFYSFATNHEVNYLLRTVAHNTILVCDPRETWPHIRAFPGEMSNDGGQHHDWPHHNGAVEDAAAWEKNPRLYDIADLLAFEDRGSHLYVAGDCSRAYSPKKLEYFTRQIVFIRPGTFVIFDRVKSTDPSFKKTWLLQAMKVPTGKVPDLVLTNGRGRLFVQTVLPENPRVEMFSGDALYRIGGRDYPPDHDVGPAPECRVEVSPSAPAQADFFLHVLTAVDSSVGAVPRAELKRSGREVEVRVGGRKLVFRADSVGGRIEIDGASVPFASSIVGY